VRHSSIPVQIPGKDGHIQERDSP